MGEKQPPPDASPYNEEFQKQIENLTKQLDQKNKIYEKCLLENAKNDELLKKKDQLLEGVDKSQRLEREILKEKYDMINKVKVNQERISENQQKENINLDTMFQNQEKVIKDLDEQLKAKQILIEKLQQNNISSKEELLCKLETLEN